MAMQRKLKPFVMEGSDQVAAVRIWAEAAAASLDDGNWRREGDRKWLTSGEVISATPEEALTHVLAAVAQAHIWDVLVEQLCEQPESHLHPAFNYVWGRRQQAVATLSRLLRRKLPLTRDEILALLRWCNEKERLSRYSEPLRDIIRALKRFVSTTPLDDDLRRTIMRFAERLRTSFKKEERRLGTTVEQLAAPSCGDLHQKSIAALPSPAPAGMDGVLEPLKRLLGMLGDEPARCGTIVEPDHFPLADQSPLRGEHKMLSELFEEVIGPRYQKPNFATSRAARAIVALEPPAIGHTVAAAAERHINSLIADTDLTNNRVLQSRSVSEKTLAWLLRLRFEVHRQGLFDVLLYLSARPSHQRGGLDTTIERLTSQAEREAEISPITEGERYVLSLFRACLMIGPPLGASSDEVQRLTRLINDGMSFFLVPGEAWTDAVNSDLSRAGAGSEAWTALLAHTLVATAARPSGRWLASARQLVDAIGGDRICHAFARWMPLVARGRTIRKLGSYIGDTRGGSDTMNDENATCLRGLLWTTPLLPRRDELVRSITAIAISAYKKVLGVGPRAVKVGNAAVYALSQMASTEAVGQLAMLKVRVKFGTAQKEIEKAFTAAAAALNLPRDEIEELGVPSYGLEEIGRREETIAEYRAELIVTGSDARLNWFDTQGKALKAVPAKVRRDHKDGLKGLQQSLKDIQSMLPAQRDRIDSMFLEQKLWPFAVWRVRYLEHPLLGTIARRLIWCVGGTPAMFIDEAATDADGGTIKHGETAEITRWHPVGRSIDEVVAWRNRLEELGITQPFKQAHREVYLLTDAERRTNTYSNRFAAHILRQHQFNALCAARGWKNKLRLMVDDAYPPASKALPQWGLRAEFWFEGIGDEYGRDTNESGVYLRLSTDQVRFYRIQAAEAYAHASGGGYAARAPGPGEERVNEPLPLELIPPLVFSEIMRDVDLFVGVASVGNDPTWQDGGPEGRYQTYWQSFAFGELSGSASTRKQALERLVPRLKIAEQCSFSDRFLVVRGKKRTYKIHLGSGNILMAPNDQYLCIVPDARARATQDQLFLPFEGDNMLSIILSKALLLADDTKIKDPTIVRQIEHHR